MFVCLFKGINAVRQLITQKSRCNNQMYSEILITVYRDSSLLKVVATINSYFVCTIIEKQIKNPRIGIYRRGGVSYMR